MSRAPSLLLAAAAALILSCRREEPRTRVVVLGFDGAGWETIEPLLEAGKLPYLARLREESAWGPLETFKPTKSPVIWTSIATGKTMAKHGILDFVFLEENGLPVPYENSERREPSIWQILDHFGKRSAVVNWFVTHPPDPIQGVMVSNRLRKILLLPVERREGMRESVHPPERFDELKPYFDVSYESVLEERELPDLGGRRDHPVLKDYPTYVRQEKLIEEVAAHLYRSGDFDFFAAYFRLPDILQHAALALLDPASVERTLEALREGRLSAEEEKAFREELSEALLPFYRYQERIIEAYVSEPGHESTYFLVISDHGFTLHRGGYDHYHVPASAPPPSGIFLLKGPGVRPGKTTEVGVYDLAPTILHLFGLPSGSDMDGRPAVSLLNLDREVRFERYSRELMTGAPGGADDELDRELDEKTIEELRALGYLP